MIFKRVHLCRVATSTNKLINSPNLEFVLLRGHGSVIQSVNWMTDR